MQVFEIREITAEETHSLRHQILRPHQPISECVLPGDEDEASFHFGAFLDDRLVTIASVFEQRESRFDQLVSFRHQFRLRGMATDEEFRGRGLGAAVLRKCIEVSWARGGDVFWCNARVTAVAYYEKMHFHSIPTEFEIPGIGMHRVMYLRQS